MSPDFQSIEFEREDASPSPLSGVSNVDLAEELECQRMRPKVWYLDPGDALTYHTQTEQEELYVPLDGPGQLRIGEELVEVPEGAAVKIPPATPRQPVNETDRRHVWLIVGAPATEDDGVAVDR